MNRLFPFLSADTLDANNLQKHDENGSRTIYSDSKML